MYGYHCPWCNPEDISIDPYFNSFDELAQHRDIEHPGKRIYLCNACDMTFNEWYEATEHVREEHDVFCDECQINYIREVVFLTPENKQRIKEIHSQIKELREEIDRLCLIPVPTSGGTE
jgi:hypothetical protein